MNEGTRFEHGHSPRDKIVLKSKKHGRVLTSTDTQNVIHSLATHKYTHSYIYTITTYRKRLSRKILL